jgi:hypothetical protein
MSEHLPGETFELLLDGALGADAEPSARRHLEQCAKCASAYAGLQAFDRLLRQQQVFEPAHNLTDDVLKRIGARPRMSLGYFLLEHTASVLAAIVVAMMAAAVWALLAFSGTAAPEAGTFPGESEIAQAESWMEKTYAGLSDWLSRVMVNMFAGHAVKIAMMLLIMVTLVAFVDWLVGRKRPV